MISRHWTYTLRTRPKQRQPEKNAASGSIVNARLKTTWNQFDRHVSANTWWDEERATKEFKKLASVEQSLACKPRVEGQAGVKVRFKLDAAFTHTLVVCGVRGQGGVDFHKRFTPKLVRGF
jgi:hypothetical protein